MIYCRNLGFTEDPDYNYLRRIFKELYVRCGFENEFIFDWTIQRYNSQVGQDSFAIKMGLKAAKVEAEGSENSPSSKEEEVSLENRYPTSNDEESGAQHRISDLQLIGIGQEEADNMQQEDPVKAQRLLNAIITEKLEQQDDEIIARYQV